MGLHAGAGRAVKRRPLLPLLALVAAGVIRLLAATLRMRTVGGEHLEALDAEGRRPLYAFWHGRQLALFGWPRPRGTAILVSLSRDGDLQARILGRLGFAVARGSAGKGGARGLVALTRLVRAGAPAAFAVDGGRGPLHVVHEGVLVLARHTGQPVVPLGCSVRRRRVLARTWDRYMIPWPFSKGAVVVGEPLEIPRNADRDAIAGLAAELGRRLHEATARADAQCGAPPEPAAAGRNACARCAAAAPR